MGYNLRLEKQDRHTWSHPFNRLCKQHEIEHRKTQVNHPWTNGQVERMNRTLKEATVQKYYYKSHKELREHVVIFLNAYNFGKRLKALRGLTPYESILKWWKKEPQRFLSNPSHYSLGSNI